ncbi:ACP S-malonyltransferase [Methylocaldum szegediense]|jgi:[acyl-carrier-protein] S-malonyltransferase|uniref:Malonyl CoA-acyl carrier protein transacylase n=1 Tax=Methylocaldum szegediense TaxID=73780 RepID=A0ABM9I6B0_9GAMM|nr:ACP S-malonyltransferase [Methylocaldum szegediense]CAI8916636.1 [acyl-carrier-protein] S-malonyltransferase [Methylocaldum szegediense]
MSTHRVDEGLAFVFPGQGSQSVGMLAELAMTQIEVESTFQTASEVLGYDLWDLVQNGPEDRLNLTQFTQPAMLAADVAAWRVWCKHTPVKPAWMAGHSLGEYSALVCSGALAFEDAVRLVAERGRLMQEAVPPETGAMAAILGLSDDQVVDVCRRATTRTELVASANFNAPGQIVIAGHRPAVTRAIELAKAEGAKRAVLLPVSVPSHCPLMERAAEEFRAMLADTAVTIPEIAVLHNVDVASHSAPEVIRVVLEKQLYSPVRWADSILFMSQQGVTRFVECGPGRVLSGLNKRIVPTSRTEAVFDPNSLSKALELVQ